MRRSRKTVLGLMVAALVAVVAWTYGFNRRPAGSISRAASLAQAGRLGEAEALAKEELVARPDSSEAHMLLAQIALNRLEPMPAPGETQRRRPSPLPATRALEHLDHVKPTTPYLAALALLYRGKAEYRLARFEEAEAAWLEALKIDPAFPEAPWCLLEMYYVEGRSELGRSLALQAHRHEPNPYDRAQLLLELLRQDAQPLAPGWVVQWFEAALEQNPGDLHGNIAMGINLIREGKGDEGLDILKRMTGAHPDQADAWEAWLTGLDEGGQTEVLLKAIAEVPGPMAALPRFAKFRARVAQEQADWPAAVAGYRLYLKEFAGDSKIKYRLARALRNSGAVAEATALEKEHQAYQAALIEVRPLYEEANRVKTLGVVPHPELCRRIANLRERMGREEEAVAWHRLVLSSRPEDAISLEAVRRLEGH